MNDLQKVDETFKQDDAEILSTAPTGICFNEDADSYDNWWNKGRKEQNDFTKPIEERTEDEIPTQSTQNKVGFYLQDRPSISFINENENAKISLKKWMFEKMEIY